MYMYLQRQMKVGLIKKKVFIVVVLCTTDFHPSTTHSHSVNVASVLGVFGETKQQRLFFVRHHIR